MQAQPVTRRLAAILAADVVGYSRLMGIDEEGTLTRLKALRVETVDPAIAAHHGRIVKTTGDGLLVVFDSVVEAMRCAIAIQRGVAETDRAEPADSRIEFRIGVNLGDIIAEDDDIYGDGVNIAARLEGLAEPGGICLSRTVLTQTRGKLAFPVEDLGEQALKNIAEPVQVYQVPAKSARAGGADDATADGASIVAFPPRRRGARPASEASGEEVRKRSRAGRPADRRRMAPGRLARAWLLALAAVVPLAGGGAWWLARLPPAAAPGAKEAGPQSGPVKAARASIAVLPFTSLSANGGNGYFADGLTEDIIAALGRFRDLSVSAPAAVFAYKGKRPTPQQVGHSLKVQYVVEGSVRRAPNRIRVSASLADTTAGSLLWSVKYDVAPKDIFTVQDDITRKVSGALAVKVTDLERAAAAAKPPSSLDAYDLVLRARHLLAHVTRSGNAEARTLFKRAIALDPGYAPAYAGLARVGLNSVKAGWTPDASGTLERAEDRARKAIALDEFCAACHAILGTVAVYFGEYDRARDELNRAIKLNASDAESYSGLTSVLLWSGDVKGAIAAGEFLTQIEPDLSGTDAFHLGLAYLLADRAADAVRVMERSFDRNGPGLHTQIVLAAAYAAAGRRDEAARQAALVRRGWPSFLREDFGTLLRDPGQRRKLSQAIEEAGL